MEKKETENKNPQDQQSWLQEMDNVDKLMILEDQHNAVYRKRMLLLIPFNFFALFATIKYFQNIQNIAKRFWPNRQKATVMNLFLVGTAQATVFTSFYLGGTLLLLGINPIAVMQKRQQILGNGIEDEVDLEADQKQISKAVEGMRMSDAFVLRMFKAMGLSESTMVQIEKDLRSQQKSEKEIKKDSDK